MRIALLSLPLIALSVLGFGFWLSPNEAPAGPYLPKGDPHEWLVLADTTLPSAYNLHFASAGVCRKCHGLDTTGMAMVDAAGQDVNVVDDWRSTMMANAARDPFWRAQMSLETHTFPQHAAEIENTCTTCHAPLGHFNAAYTGTDPYTLDELLSDPVGLDGVSCMACHSQTPDSLSAVHSGRLHLDTLRRVFGPYPMPLISPMLTATSFTPVHGPHIRRAESCGSCHSLITHTLDASGSATGQTFVEQATWHEWLNSAYPAQQVRCQDCHMTSLGKTPVDIAANSTTMPRQPFFRHDLVGANAFMLRLMKDHIEPLGLKAGPQHFDETIDATIDMLQQRSLQLDAALVERTADSALLRVQLTNLAGHKLPSGYPSRRMFVSCVLTTPEGDTLFASGILDSAFALPQRDDPFEPHHDTIRSADQVQIYEMVMADATGAPTTVLEMGASALKDNRLPPLGFSQSHYTADTTRIVGAALHDDDFNRADGVEGTGADVLWYQLPLAGHTGELAAHVAVWYQAVPPEWVGHLFDINTDAIDQFEAMYEAADRMPVLMRDTTLWLPAVTAQAEPDDDPQAFAKCYLLGGELHLEARHPWSATIWTIDGQALMHAKGGAGHFTWPLPVDTGVVIVALRNEGGTRAFRLVLH